MIVDFVNCRICSEQHVPRGKLIGFQVKDSSAYEISGVLTKAPDFAIASVSIDNEVVAAKIDSHDSQVRPTEKISLGTHRLEAGRHTLAIVIEGRNPSNDADVLAFGIDYIELVESR